MTSRTLLVSTCVLAASVLLTGGAAAHVTDLVPPLIDVAPPSVTNSQTAHFEFSSTDQEVTFSCSLDGASFSPCGSPQDYESLLEGPHTFAVKTSHPLEEDSSPATHNWLIDLTPPAVSLTTPAQGSATQDQTPPLEGFGGTAGGDDADVTIELRAGSDAGSPPVLVLTEAVDAATGAWSASLDEPLPAGIYNVRATQADAAGNSAVSVASFAVDTTPPAFAAVGASQVIEQTAAAGAVATYGPPATDELDPAPKVACSPPSGAVFPVGVTTVTCSATDWAGNSAETQLSVTVVNTIHPAGVQGLRVQTGNRRVGLTWRNPGDWDFDRVVIRRTLRGASAWQVVYQGSGTAFTDRGVVNDTEYLYETVSYDGAGNASASVSTGARPSAFFAPIWNATLRRPPTLRWAAARKAAYYNVQLWRNGRKILSRWPGDPRFLLQKTWRDQGRRYSLRAGTYFAYAWPGFGPRTAGRYGRLIGWTKFRVS
jgi:hypothetical protein